MIQDLITLGIVACAILILAKKMHAAIQKMAQGTCGGCSSCAAEKSCQLSESQTNEQMSFQV
ncbi:hypothetical protein [Candidatus Uabimicrobium amorphum]|uniref:FeoB-associated Cys-rich membrane protein n=1 Tax=Uabimicrobium amorphum TaxID=2596890 RepID=A0A5S9IKA4_UABAM|nr:hypothetical protein [Candidatus Uabimicrobium amorphum]BBM83428.1 hypothetical protein UABAM_01780 [Candidatus Uabimicrobium amorphum]